MFSPAFVFGALLLVAIPVAWRVRTTSGSTDRTRGRVFLAVAVAMVLVIDWRMVPALVGAALVTWFCSQRAGRLGFVTLGIVTNMVLLVGPALGRAVGAATVVAGDAVGLDATGWFGSFGIAIALVVPAMNGISYLMGVRRGRVAALAFEPVAVLMAGGPAVFAGPVLGWSEMSEPRTAPGGAVDVGRSVRLITRGAVKKLIVANLLARFIVQPVFGAPQAASSWDLWAALYAGSVMVWAEFSGFMDVARGASLLLGVALPEPDDRPFQAATVREFWQRWNASIMDWLDVVLYQPLLGRGGTVRQVVALFTTALAGSLWFGIRPAVLAFGLLQAALVAVGAWRAGVRSRPRPARPVVVERLRTELGLETSLGTIPTIGDASTSPGSTLGADDPDRWAFDLPAPPEPATIDDHLPIFATPIPGRVVVGHLMAFSWILVLTPSLGDAGAFVGRLFTAWGTQPVFVTPGVLVVTALAIAAQFVPARWGYLAEWRISRLPGPVLAVGGAVVLIVLWKLTRVLGGWSPVAPSLFGRFG